MTTQRVAGGEVRAAAARRGIFTALAVRYGVVDMYGSVWWPGCFDASLARRLPVILFGHEHGDPVGRATSWRATPEGPEVTAQLDMSPDVPRGRQAAAQLASGTLTDVSVGFRMAKRRMPTDDERSRWPGVTEVILQAELDELSIVAIGAVPGALVTSSRSAGLARSLAEGRITPATYRREMDLEADLAAAMERVSKWAAAPNRGGAAARQLLQRSQDPVAKWVGIVEAKEALKAAEQAAQERQRSEQAARDKAHAERRNENPFSDMI